MKAQALALMGRKMRAAQLLYGDTVSGAIVPVEEGDFITELAREVLRGAELVHLQSLFADEMRVSHSPMGCPTETSPMLISAQFKTWSEWLAARNKALPVRNGRRKSAAAQGQLSLF